MVFALLAASKPVRLLWPRYRNRFLERHLILRGLDLPSPRGNRILLLKQLAPPFALRISRIPNLEPPLAVRAVLQLGHNALQIVLASQPVKLEASALDMPCIQHG